VCWAKLALSFKAVPAELPSPTEDGPNFRIWKLDCIYCKGGIGHTHTNEKDFHHALWKAGGPRGITGDRIIQINLPG
jgi:hypothetical protein